MCSPRDPDLRDLLAGIIDWRARHIPPQRRATYAASAVAELFGLKTDENGEDLDWHRHSATDLMSRGFASPRFRSDQASRYVNFLLMILRDLDERWGDSHYQGFGAWCDRLVDEVAQPNRELCPDNIHTLLREVGCERLRRTHPVVE